MVMELGNIYSYLDLIIQLLVYPGLFFIVFMVIFTQWIHRKVTGRIQYRRGPSYTGPFGFLQPLADFLKLLMKEDVVSKYSLKLLPVIAASLGVGALVTLLLFTPVAYKPIYGFMDVIIFFYLSVWSALAILFIGIGTPNPYTSLGVGRYMALLSVSEPIFIASFLAPVIIASKYYNGSYSIYLTAINSHMLWTTSVLTTLVMLFSAIAGFIAMMGVLEIKPFDFPEAEGEIYWGVFTEYGGPRLALAFFVLFTERIVIPLLYVLLFLGGSWPIDITTNYVGGVIVILIKFLIVFIILSVIDNVMPRYRPDHGIRALVKYGLTFAVIALVTALFI